MKNTKENLPKDVYFLMRYVNAIENGLTDKADYYRSRLEQMGFKVPVLNKTDVLSVNDTVMWKGCFGSEPAREAKVINIEITNGGKHGKSVSSVPWSKVTDRNVCVDLENGHWAYASQLSRKQ